MKSGNFIELTFVVKGELQVEFINKEVSKETKVVAPAEAEKPVEDEESDDTTVFCLDETMEPAMFYTEGELRKMVEALGN